MCELSQGTFIGTTLKSPVCVQTSWAIRFAKGWTLYWFLLVISSRLGARKCIAIRIRWDYLMCEPFRWTFADTRLAVLARRRWVSFILNHVVLSRVLLCLKSNAQCHVRSHVSTFPCQDRLFEVKKKMAMFCPNVTSVFYLSFGLCYKLGKWALCVLWSLDMLAAGRLWVVRNWLTFSNLHKANNDDHGEGQELGCCKEVLHSGRSLHTVAVHKGQDH